MNETELAETTVARICHDLVSPMGAIGNGLELLAMTGQPPTPELSLISQSAENANARLRFFRVAFGGASAGATMAARDSRAIVGAMFGSGRLEVDWQVADDSLRTELKLAFLLLLCFETTLPRGGLVQVRRADRLWHLWTDAERGIDAGKWANLLAGGPTPTPPDKVHFTLAAHHARHLGRQLDICSDSGASVSF